MIFLQRSRSIQSKVSHMSRSTPETEYLPSIAMMLRPGLYQLWGGVMEEGGHSCASGRCVCVSV